jgi:hypothetical protein
MDQQIAFAVHFNRRFEDYSHVSHTASFPGFSVRQIGSPRYSTETSSLYYGLLFYLQLHPTLPHGNAVIFSYKGLTTFDRDFHPAGCARSRAHCRRIRGST